MPTEFKRKNGIKKALFFIKQRFFYAKVTVWLIGRDSLDNPKTLNDAYIDHMQGNPCLIFQDI